MQFLRCMKVCNILSYFAMAAQKCLNNQWFGAAAVQNYHRPVVADGYHVVVELVPAC